MQMALIVIEPVSPTSAALRVSVEWEHNYDIVTDTHHSLLLTPTAGSESMHWPVQYLVGRAHVAMNQHEGYYKLIRDAFS